MKDIDNIILTLEIKFKELALKNEKLVNKMSIIKKKAEKELDTK